MNEIGPEKLEHSVVLKSDPSSVPRARQYLERLLSEAQVPNTFILDMCLVVDEAVANAVSHGSNSGSQEVVLSCQIRDGILQILVEDFQGRIFDPEYFRRIAVVKDWGKGGRGILLMEMMMDHMAYLIEEGNHTMLYLEKALPSGSPGEVSKT